MPQARQAAMGTVFATAIKVVRARAAINATKMIE